MTVVVSTTVPCRCLAEEERLSRAKGFERAAGLQAGPWRLLSHRVDKICGLYGGQPAPRIDTRFLDDS